MTRATPVHRARVVSLVPSVTETLLAWGVEPVAVTRFCEQPGRMTVGGTKNPDVGAITRLAPDLVVMDREENRVEDADALAALGVPLHILHVRSVADVPASLAELALAVDAPAGSLAAPPLPDGAEEAAARRPRVFVPIWRRPWMSIGAATYGSSILEAAGFVNVLADATDPYPKLDLEDVASLAPDAVFAPSEPYAFSERHRRELELVAPVTFVDGKDLFWWGSRTTGALARLTELRRALP